MTVAEKEATEACKRKEHTLCAGDGCTCGCHSHPSMFKDPAALPKRAKRAPSIPDQHPLPPIMNKSPLCTLCGRPVRRYRNGVAICPLCDGRPLGG